MLEQCLDNAACGKHAYNQFRMDDILCERLQARAGTDNDHEGEAQISVMD